MAVQGSEIKEGTNLDLPVDKTSLLAVLKIPGASFHGWNSCLFKHINDSWLDHVHLVASNDNVVSIPIPGASNHEIFVDIIRDTKCVDLCMSMFTAVSFDGICDLSRISDLAIGQQEYSLLGVFHCIHSKRILNWL
jgi:hypothetical protein